MLFNPDVTKQAQESLFFLERKMIQVIQVYALIMRKYKSNLFKNNFDIFLDENLWLLEHIEVKIKKTTIGVNLMSKLNLLLPHLSLLTVYNFLVSPCLDYGDVLYNRTNPSSLTNKIKLVQCSAALGIVVAIRKIVPEVRF